MTLTPGTRIGSYEIVSLVGAGGMGEVYRARDAKLQRDVALKILPPAFAADAERVARFEREAQVLASLNHPNIAAIYGFEEGRALVLELVEGPTLADRIADGPIPIDEALPIAKQIAEALEAAHEHGVIHRDLKPANIKLRADGTVKVLDFGLAKLQEPAGAATASVTNVTLSPTVMSPAATQIGIILGTAAYMSPEQAKGKAVDRRADLWAFGCVLYEMLTGKRAFDGDDVTDFVVSILSREPDWTRLPAATPPALERLMRRCLAKDRRQRLSDAAAARLDIDEASTTPIVSRAAHARTRGAWLGWAVAMVALAVCAWLAVRIARVPGESAPAVRFDLKAPDGTSFVPGFSTYAISADGRRIVFEAVSKGGRRSLWMRSLSSTTPTEIPGTDGGRRPIWSPDGASVAFFAAGKLRRVDVASGAAVTLTDASTTGATWNDDGVILYGGDVIRRIPASGGMPVPATELDTGSGDTFHMAPEFLPDGRRFLFLAPNPKAGASRLLLASLDGGEPQVLLTGTSNAVYSEGHLLYARQGTLMAHPFDADDGRLTGEPIVIAESVRLATVPAAAFAAGGGTLVLDAGRTFPEAEIAGFGRDGRETGTFPARGPYHTMWPSPDFKRAVVEGGATDGGTDLWIVDADRGARTRLTSTTSTDGHPVWSPDGKEIAFFEGVVGTTSRLLIGPASGVREPRVVLDTPSYKQVTDWSRDGRLLVFEEQNGTTSWDLSVVPVDGSALPTVVVKSRFSERLGVLSPDNRFLAYVSEESGRPEVYVVNYPGVTDKWTVSAGGGTKPRWRRDGGELFFVSASGTLMSVTVQPGGSFVASVPRPLFDLELIQSDGSDYAVSDDGQRFLALRYAGTDEASISVIANWTEALRK